MKNQIKITITEKIETHHEVELPCYRMGWCNDEPWTIYKISGNAEKQTVETVELYRDAPTYGFNCLPNAFREGNTVSTEMEWINAIQSVVNHLNKEVETACKVQLLTLNKI